MNTDPNDEQFLADLKKAQELANIEGDDRVGFTLGEGNAYQKKNRIQLQVQRLMDDPSQYYKMKQQIRKAKEERLKAQISAATQADKKKSKQIFKNEELISNDFFLTADSRFVS